MEEKEKGELGWRGWRSGSPAPFSSAGKAAMGPSASGRVSISSLSDRKAQSRSGSFQDPSTADFSFDLLISARWKLLHILQGNNSCKLKDVRVLCLYLWIRGLLDPHSFNLFEAQVGHICVLPYKEYACGNFAGSNDLTKRFSQCLEVMHPSKLLKIVH